MATCYLCGANADSKDHIPPQVFFPETKDLPPGQDYRKNLITVPCCIKCNNEFSEDDEYVAFAVVVCFTNNAVAVSQVGSKVLRALKRSEPLMKRLFGTNTKIQLEGEETLAFEIDVDAFNRVMTRIAKALYFRKYGTQLPHAVIATSPALVGLPGGADPRWKDIFRAIDQLPFELGPECKNPDVFAYKVLVSDSAPHGRRCMYLFKFYGGFFVTVGPRIKP